MVRCLSCAAYAAAKQSLAPSQHAEVQRLTFINSFWCFRQPGVCCAVSATHRTSGEVAKGRLAAPATKYSCTQHTKLHVLGHCQLMPPAVAEPASSAYCCSRDTRACSTTNCSEQTQAEGSGYRNGLCNKSWAYSQGVLRQLARGLSGLYCSDLPVDIHALLALVKESSCPWPYVTETSSWASRHSACLGL